MKAKHTNRLRNRSSLALLCLSTVAGISLADDVKNNPYFTEKAKTNPDKVEPKSSETADKQGVTEKQTATARLQNPSALPTVPVAPMQEQQYSMLPALAVFDFENKEVQEPFSTLPATVPKVEQSFEEPYSTLPDPNPAFPAEHSVQQYSTLPQVQVPAAPTSDPFSVLPSPNAASCESMIHPEQYTIAQPAGFRQPNAPITQPLAVAGTESPLEFSGPMVGGGQPMPLAQPQPQPTAQHQLSQPQPSDVLVDHPIVDHLVAEPQLAMDPSSELSPPPLELEAKPRPARLPAIVVEMPHKEPEMKTVSHPRRMPKPKQPGIDVTAEQTEEDLETVHWLPSKSTSSEQKATQRFLNQASREFSVRAYASAERSVWLALHSSAEAVDIADRATNPEKGRGVETMVSELNAAKTAIREARDFAGKYGALNAEGVRRIVRSHQTKTLKAYQHQDISANDASDLYLNDARVRLGRLAASQVHAAQAMDLLAAIYLGRGDKEMMADETALTLRRAALQGQPGNGSLALQLGKQLADLGLDHEAKWALSHSLQIQPSRDATELLATVSSRLGQRDAAMKLMQEVRERFPDQPKQQKRIPTITQVTPEQFAAISRPMMTERGAAQNVQASAVEKADPEPAVTPAAYQKWAGQEKTETPPAKASAPRRFLKSLGKMW